MYYALIILAPEIPTQPLAEIKPGPPTPAPQLSVAMPADSLPKGARSEHKVSFDTLCSENLNIIL